MAMATIPAGKKPANTPPARKKAARASARSKKPAAPRTTPATRTAVKVVRTVSALEPRQQRFVDEYLVDLNAAQAAIRAGYSEKTAKEIGYENLTKPHIAAAIAEARRRQQERTQITADAVLREAWNIAIADARELVQVKVGCCRHCHGEGFRFQRTIAEFNHDREEFSKKPGAMPADFEEQGGIGFNPLRAPHPECPECGGDGDARVVIMETRHLSAQARALYAGAKQGKHGIEVQLHDKATALEKLFKHLGLYEKDNQQRVDPLASLLHTIASSNGNGFKPVARDPERD